MSFSNSPFKFLDSYKKADVKVFFGREQETQDLYDALSGVKHLMVYGPSGSGKSSLVECGLRNQFSDADWFALTIRKGRDINASVFMAINEALYDKIDLNTKTKLPVDPKIGFGEAIEKLFEERYQPVYLLFDQFEELLITGEQDEKIEFFTNLNKLIRNRLPSRVLLIMREEFIGHFSEFESLCPSIFQHRFRVEKMGRKHVQEVIQKILEAKQYSKYFDVKDSQGLAESILEKLPDKRKEIELSHVQVFLGELWDRANLARKEGELPVFSTDLLKKKDNLESVLESFLIKQIGELEKDYGIDVPMELLAAMISEKFTKLQLSEADIKAELVTKNITNKRPLNELLKALEQRRIIRAIKVGDESQYEISHDTLALVVGQNLTEEMKMREKALDVYYTYAEQQGLFSQENIDHLRAFEPYLAYPDAIQKRIKESEAKMKADENEKQQKQNKQLRRTKIFAAVISIIGVGAIVASVFAVKYALRSKELTIKADMKTSEAESEKAKAIKHKAIADSTSIIAKELTKKADSQAELAQRRLENYQKLTATLIGAKYQGGIIFSWNDKTGKHGLIAAEKDLDSTYTWEEANKASENYSVAVNGKRYNDWRLPTRDELNRLSVNKSVIGGFGDYYYWSSSEDVNLSHLAWAQDINNTSQLNDSKSEQNRVRVVRAY